MMKLNTPLAEQSAVKRARPIATITSRSGVGLQIVPGDQLKSYVAVYGVQRNPSPSMVQSHSIRDSSDDPVAVTSAKTTQPNGDAETKTDTIGAPHASYSNASGISRLSPTCEAT